jgi:hypothetical protein
LGFQTHWTQLSSHADGCFVGFFIALASIFNIFTLFELWRFIVLNNSSAALVGRCRLLLPLVAVELFPA